MVNILPDSQSISGLKSAVRGVPIVFLRQFVTFIATIGGGVLLARILSPSDFGIYALITSILAFMRLITDGGLGSSLIQQRVPPQLNEYKQVFTAQFIAVLILVIASELCLYFLVPSSLFLVPNWKYSVAISLVGLIFTPIISNAVSKLERDLDYAAAGYLAMVQPVVFNVSAVVLALMDFGVVSIGIAATISQVGTAVVALILKSPVGITLDFDKFIEKLKFGIPFTFSQAFSVIKDSVGPIFIGIYLGAELSGIINWAQTVAILPSLFVMALARYIFPVLSRATVNIDLLNATINSILLFLNLLVFPATFVLIFFTKPVAEFLYGSQWVSGFSIIPLLAIANFEVPFLTLIIALLNAQGRPVIPLVLAATLSLLTWILIPMFEINMHIGKWSYVVCILILQLVGPFIYLFVFRQLKVQYIQNVLFPLVLSGVIPALIAFLFSREILHQTGILAQFGIAAGSLTATYISLLIIYKSKLTQIRKFIRE